MSSNGERGPILAKLLIRDVIAAQPTAEKDVFAHALLLFDRVWIQVRIPAQSTPANPHKILFFTTWIQVCRLTPATTLEGTFECV